MTVVIVVLVSLMTILTIVIGLPFFILWIIRNSLQAAKYRRSLTMEIKREGFTVVYKSGRKIETLDVDGNTEGEAVRDLIKRGIKYDKITSITKKI